MAGHLHGKLGKLGNLSTAAWRCGAKNGNLTAKRNDTRRNEIRFSGISSRRLTGKFPTSPRFPQRGRRTFILQLSYFSAPRGIEAMASSNNWQGHRGPLMQNLACLSCLRAPQRASTVCLTGINQEINDVSEADKTFEEMARIVDQAHQSDFHYRQLEQQEWEAEQRAKALAIVGLLRQHLPTPVLQEAEGLLSTRYGCQCVCNLLQREQDRRALQEELPEAESEEIENFLDTGVWRSKDELAKHRAERKVMIDRGGIPF